MDVDRRFWGASHSMSALGHKRTLRSLLLMPALPPKAGIATLQGGRRRHPGGRAADYGLIQIKLVDRKGGPADAPSQALLAGRPAGADRYQNKPQAPCKHLGSEFVAFHRASMAGLAAESFGRTGQSDLVSLVPAPTSACVPIGTPTSVIVIAVSSSARCCRTIVCAAINATIDTGDAHWRQWMTKASLGSVNCQ